MATLALYSTVYGGGHGLGVPKNDPDLTGSLATWGERNPPKCRADCPKARSVSILRPVQGEIRGL